MLNQSSLPSAQWCEHAAALLAGGLPVARLADHLAPLRAADDLRLQLDRAIRVSVAAGCPLTSMLRQLAAAAQQAEAAAAERAGALAVPRATTRMLVLLPVAALPIGASLGAESVRFLFGSVLGWLCLALGAALLWLAWRWSRALLRRAESRAEAPGIALDVLASLVEAGTSPERALEYWGALDEHEAAQFSRAVDRARQAGCGLARSLRAAAISERLERHAAAQRAARSLAVWLAAPLGLCVLPSFVLWGVLPIVAGIAGSTLGR